jgi:nucleoside-diphosphate-sugar epimerase
MRVFVAGASGAIGTRLVPQLAAAGHQVTGTFSRPEKETIVRKAGATPVRLDILDARATSAAIKAARPDAIVHQATAIAHAKWGRSLDKTFAATNRLRREGTDHLLAAAREHGVPKFVAQSFANYRYERRGSWVKSEDDPLDPTPPRTTRQTCETMAYLDSVVAKAGGIALRYGGFYGETDNAVLRLVRKRFYPVIGEGTGYLSWVHLEDAAAATVLALEHDRPGVFNIVDDEPAPMSEWLPVLARSLAAKPPRRVSAGIASLLAGKDGVTNALEARGAANAKAKRDLGWKPRYPTWRQGFFAAHAREA